MMTMGPDKRDTLGAPSRPSRIPAPSFATTEATKAQAPSTKTGMSSPRRRTFIGLGRLKEVTASTMLPANTAPQPACKRPAITATTSKVSKSLMRPVSAQPCDEKDDTRQRDSGHKDAAVRKDVLQRDKAFRDVALRRPASTSEAGSQPDSGKRLLKQPSVLFKSAVASSAAVAPASTTASCKATAPAATKPTPQPRSISTCRDRLPNDTRTSIMRRSMSVGKGRTLATAPVDHFPQQQAGAKFRPTFERPASAAGALGRQLPDRRDTSAGRIRPAGTAGKADVSHSGASKPALQTIAEAPARPAASSCGGTGTAKPALTKPLFSLNLAAVKQHVAAAAAAPAPAPDVAPPPPAASAPITTVDPTPASAAAAAPAAPAAATDSPEALEPSAGAEPLQPPPLPLVEPSPSISPECSGRPVPKLDLGGILQRRAEEQASEPVFVVAASSEDTGQVSATSQQGQQDKRKSGSRQASAKEEPAEHFYLYPKVKPQEKKRIEDICRVVPKKQQAVVQDLFTKMVEARQNCEQMCFRGHRLLDQAQAEFRTRLAQKDEEVAQTKEEAAQWRQEAEYLRTQLALLLGARQADEGMESAYAPKEPEATEEERAACLRSSLLSTFDNMARLHISAGSEPQDGVAKE